MELLYINIIVLTFYKIIPIKRIKIYKTFSFQTEVVIEFVFEMQQKLYISKNT